MRLLIVEDNKKLALSLKKALETESYAVDVAYDGGGNFHAETNNEKRKTSAWLGPSHGPGGGQGGNTPRWQH